jgi:phosphoribosylformylglycinamidine cyclo-ligase
MKYEDSGVNIDAAQKALAGAKAAVRSTWDERVRSDLGAFGGLYRPAPGEPLLVASVDGVGTKVKVAAMAGRYDTVGQDLVNHCVNDILVQGAEPLFFLDYFATGKLLDNMLEPVIEGFAKACRENGCALLGGETAEMPGVYGDEDFDLAGCIVGRVEEKDVIDGSAIRAGDRLWGLPSTGLHTNGYSLARKVFFDLAGHDVDDRPENLGGPSVGEALLAIHRSYLPELREIWWDLGRDAVHGLAHITGGGFTDNIPRIMPDGLCARVDARAWEVPPVFRVIQTVGEVAPAEMYRVFNMGVGLVLVMPHDTDEDLLTHLGAFPIGGVDEGDDRVEVVL